jgi:hypothetical protein
VPRFMSEVGQSAAAFARTLQDCGRSFCTRRGFEHEKREVGKRCLLSATHDHERHPSVGLTARACTWVVATHAKR